MNYKKIFPEFEDELVEVLEKEAIVKSFQPGEILMRTGQFIKSTYLILEGRIKVYREHEDGGEFLIYFLSGGEACALSMICTMGNEKSEILAKIEEPTEVLMIPVTLMNSLMSKFKSWQQFVVNTYSKRFDELLNVVDQIAFQNMDERLLFYLKRYAEKTGKQKLDVSHQQIADDLNSSREVISRLLKKMEQKEMIVLNRNMIELKDLVNSL